MNTRTKNVPTDPAPAPVQNPVGGKKDYIEEAGQWRAVASHVIETQRQNTEKKKTMSRRTQSSAE